MFLYKISLFSVSKQTLVTSISSFQNAIDTHKAYTSVLRSKFDYRPIIEVSSLKHKKIKRFSSPIKKISVIRSPFVFKKSGETFFFRYYQAYFFLELSSKKNLDLFKVNSILRFLLKNQNKVVAEKGVEIRITSFGYT